MQTLTYDEVQTVSRSSRPAFTRAYAFSIATFALAVAAAMLLG